ncbi:hypothetical protein Spith_0160 [Spirochaeta thermophila DSM 6578]|uniref:AMP-activated protein kinase glycogen-binding domain-containing protein n=1 Tax=Winmispira thermophila (strain ATCC 700085 / DSM 6578 / Z-1203) TaxID=869211 RepID=G0GC83_WINT7|nr:hypothetical protein [Spirochaeta thermophila]AEJ60447.1 hypothetical protein Spith_0160 [Spirochaeta thermophila DSM 6578]
MEKSKFILAGVCLLCFGLSLSSQDLGFIVEDKDLHLYLLDLKEARPPHTKKNRLVFTFQGSTRTRSVGIAFSFERFRTVHLMARNPSRIFFYVLDPPEDRFTYRLVVDGVWMADPSNPVVVEDEDGVRLSLVSLPPRPAEEAGPVPLEGEIAFLFRYTPGRRVFLVGEFCNWDPFLLPMEEVEPGLYRKTLSLPAGTYAYYFLADGKRIADPENPRRVYLDAIPVSLVEVPPRISARLQD